MSLRVVVVETDGASYWWYCNDCDAEGPERASYEDAANDGIDHECK